MNSIISDIVKNAIKTKKYGVISELAKIEYPDKNDLIVTEYAGSGVRLYKDNKNRVRLLCPRDIDVYQENHVAEAIANGTIFDDADAVDNNAEMIEKTTIPYNAMINSGKCVPKKLKPMIAIVISKMDDDGSFDVSDIDRENGNKFVKAIVCCKDKGTDVPTVVGDYIEKDKEAFYTPEMGRDIVDLEKESDDIYDTNNEDVITDDDTVEDYGGKIPQSGDFDGYGDDVDLADHDKDPVDDKEESNEDEDEIQDDDSDEDDNDDDDDEESDDDEIKDDKDDDDIEEDDDDDITEESYYPNIDNETYQEGFLSKKPKKLKPIPRDIIAYITVEMNDISSANDQAMLSGYTCSKLELVDFYLTVIDTQDPRYIVPHTKQYLETMKLELERLLAKILRIRPINKSDRIWRMNVTYPEGWRG